MATIAPANVIDAPARVPAPFGLFSVVPPVENPAFKWEAGVEWTDQSCDLLPGVIIPACDPDDAIGLPKDFSATLGEGSAQPFVLYGDFKCSPVGWPPDEAQDAATARLLTREEAAATTALWAMLTSTDPDAPLAGTALADGDPETVVAALEQHLAATYGSQGVLIASPLAVMRAAGVLNYSANRLTTYLGTPVVVNRLATDASVGIVPRPVVYRSEVLDSSGIAGDLLDRRTNDLYAIAERQYVAGWVKCGGAYANISSESGGGFGV